MNDPKPADFQVVIDRHDSELEELDRLLSTATDDEERHHFEQRHRLVSASRSVLVKRMMRSTNGA